MSARAQTAYAATSGIAHRRDVPLIRSDAFRRITGISERQLQWWSEKRILDCDVVGHTRWFSINEGIVAHVIQRSRRAGVLRAGQVRQATVTIRAAIRSRVPQYLIVTSRGIIAAESEHKLVETILRVQEPCIALRLWPIYEALTEAI